MIFVTREKQSCKGGSAKDPGLSILPDFLLLCFRGGAGGDC